MTEPKTSQTALESGSYHCESFMAEFGSHAVVVRGVQPNKALSVYRIAGRGMTVRNTVLLKFGFGVSDRESFVAEFKAKDIGDAHA